MKCTLLFLYLIAFGAVGHSQVDADLAEQLQDVLNSSVSNAGNNGVSACAILPNGNTWAGTAGVGYQNVPISDTTLFHGASTTKLNVAALMMLLAEDNLVDLDAPWSNYLELDVAFDTTITIRQLLNHTSGLADYLETPSSGQDVTADFNYFFTPQFILETIVSGEPDFPAGTDFNYSNTNYVMAGLIVEEVTGYPVHVELRNRIWNPLGMTHTYFGAYETYTEPTAGVWWNFGSGVTNYSNVPTTSMLSYAYGAGNIVTCPKDLGLLLTGLMDNQLVSSQSLNEMLTFDGNSYTSWTAGYGLGIHHYEQTTDEVIGHDGYYSNLTDVFYSMNCGFTLVTMTNTQSSWFGIFDPMFDILTNHCNTMIVEEKSRSMELNVYPNPARYQFDVSSSNLMDKVEVLDLAGKVCRELIPKAKSVTIVIDQPGVYLVKLYSNTGSQVKRLVVTGE